MTEPFGPNHPFMRSGSAKHLPTSTRGASNTREVTKSAHPVSATIVISIAGPQVASAHSPRAEDHPTDAELVRAHAEPRRKERLRHWHVHLPAFSQRIE